MDSFTKKILTKTELWLIILTILAGFFRFWRLSQPTEFVFDEVYYANFAQNYLLAKDFFDVHPPLAKLLIALSIKIFGFTSFAWRFMPALLGTLLIPMSYYLVNLIFKNKLISIFTAFLITFDGLFLVEARTSLIDPILVFFVVLFFLLNWRYLESKTNSARKIYLIVTILVAGLNLATKWTFLPFLLFVLIYNSYKEKFQIKMIFKNISFFLIIPILIYSAFFLFDQYKVHGGYFDYLVWWHKNTWNYHLLQNQIHPYQSRWWTWLLIERPVWFYFKVISNKTYGIIALGNPVIWWPAILSLLISIYSIIKHKKTELFLAVTVFLFYYLGWAIISRTQFQYYLLPALPFYFVILAYWLEKIYRFNKYLLFIYLFLVIIGFLFFYPIYTAYPISNEFYQHHTWFKSWI